MRLSMEIQNITEAEREKLFDEHPVITKDYLIATPVIHYVYSLLRDRVWTRSTGTFMYASPRMGKSTCAKVIQKLLEEQFPKIHIIHFTAESSNSTSALLMDILDSERIRVAPNMRYKEIQRLLFTHIQSKSVEKKGQQLVLMIDEMQNLRQSDFEQLATIHNRLESIGIRMTTLGFANPSILPLRAALKKMRCSYLIARFLSEPIGFQGCASKDDLTTILEYYDNKLFYPAGSTYTFTKFFLPIAYENGFKISAYAEEIWRELLKASNELKEDSVPMEHLSRTVEYLLISSTHADTPKFKLTREIIRNAVEASNLWSFSSSLG